MLLYSFKFILSIYITISTTIKSNPHKHNLIIFYNKKIAARKAPFCCIFFRYKIFKAQIPARCLKDVFSASCSCCPISFNTILLTSSTVSRIGSSKSFPLSVNIISTKRRSSLLTFLLINPFFSILSRTPEIVEFSSLSSSAISFGLFFFFTQRQYITPYCTGVTSNLESCALIS